jgi:hypothetical protein
MASSAICRCPGRQLLPGNENRLDARAVGQHQGGGQGLLQVGLHLGIRAWLPGLRLRRQAGDDVRRLTGDLAAVVGAVGDDLPAQGFGFLLAARHEGGRELVEDAAIGQQFGLVAGQAQQEVPPVFLHVGRAEEVDPPDVREAEFADIPGEHRDCCLPHR